MKKIFLWFLMLALLLSTSACTNGVEDEPIVAEKEETQTKPQETQAKPHEIQLNEKITIGEKAFALTEFEWTEELLVGKKWSPGSGNTFARIQVSFYNEGRKEMNLCISCRMNYDNGYEITSFFGENGYFNTSYPIDIDLAAGRSFDLIFAAAEVTEYAKTDTDTPLWIEIEFEGEQYICYIRK